jgi:hypothetical protein
MQPLGRVVAHFSTLLENTDIQHRMWPWGRPVVSSRECWCDTPCGQDDDVRSAATIAGRPSVYAIGVPWW